MERRRWVVVGGVAVVATLLLGCPGQVVAADRPLCPICSKANNASATYAEKAGNTLARGVLNLGLGWTELIRQPAKKARAGGNVFLGMLNGVGHSATRSARGLGEILTFWVPKVQGEYVHFSKDCPLDTMK